MARPSLRHLFDNFASYHAPLPSKLRMLVTNQLTKVRTGSACCGHRGEPGC
jgi:hypothetical protein